MKSSLLLTVVLASIGLNCSNEEVTYQSALETKSEFYLNQAETARGQLLSEIRQTRDTIDVAVTRLEDVELANALVTAAGAGAKVRVVGDAHYESDEGFQVLNNYVRELLFDDDDSNDDLMTIAFGNGEFRYLPDPTLSPLLDNCGYAGVGDKVICPSADPIRPLSNRLMLRPGDYNLMSHNFFILGPRVVWNFASPFDGSTTIPLAWRIDGEMLKESFWREFNQMNSGVFATKLSIYNGPIKSGTQYSPIYITEYGEFRMRFGPQERIVKSLIDDAYKARASVFVMTDSLNEQFMVDALEYKNDNGFEVRVIVNQAAQDEEMLARLRNIDARFAPASLGYVPTVVIVDSEPNRLGEVEQRRVHVLSHPIWKTAPFQLFAGDPNDYIEIYKSDYFADGLMWSLYAYKGQDSPNIDSMLRLFNTTWDASTEAN